MFKDSKSGQTHSFGDGCGEPAHNTPEKWEEEFDRNFKYVFSEKDPIYGAENTQNKNAIKIFISHAISESVEEEWERIAYHLKYINWTNSQTGIAIGTKKAVIEEALSIINEKWFSLKR